MTPETRILQKLFDEDFIHLDDFNEADKRHLRDLWKGGLVKFDDKQLFSITPAGCNALAVATAPANPSPAGTIILSIEAAKVRRVA